MIRTEHPKKRLAIVLLLSTALAGTALAAADKPEDAVKMRQGFMQTQKLQVGKIGAVAKGKAEFSDDTIQRARNMRALSLMIPDMFVPGSSIDDVPAANALPKLWENMDDVQDRIKRLQAETARLAEIAEQRDVATLGKQLKRTLKVCKGCHDTYKKAAKKETKADAQPEK